MSSAPGTLRLLPGLHISMHIGKGREGGGGGVSLKTVFSSLLFLLLFSFKVALPLSHAVYTTILYDM